MAAKGLNRNGLQTDSAFTMFKQVYDTQIPAGATNTGFKKYKSSIFTYQMYKQCLPYLYLKRDLIRGKNEKGIGPHFTRCLPNLVLDPVPRAFVTLQTDYPLLTADNDQLTFVYKSNTLKSIRQGDCLNKLLYVTQYKPMDPNSLHEKKQAIIQSTEPKVLREIEQSLGICQQFDRCRYLLLAEVVQARMETYPILYSAIDLQNNQYIVNASGPGDRILGAGVCQRTALYRSDCHKEGFNYLGKVYAEIRDRLKKVLLPKEGGVTG